MTEWEDATSLLSGPADAKYTAWSDIDSEGRLSELLGESKVLYTTIIQKIEG